MKRSRISRKPKAKSIGWYKRILDTVFSQYIRQRKAVDGIATCVTCGAKAHWKKMQNGHYVPRNHMATRYDEINCNVQCIGCNMFKNGAMDEYAIFLLQEHGENILIDLNSKKREIRQIRIPEYQELIEVYKKKIKDLDANN